MQNSPEILIRPSEYARGNIFPCSIFCFLVVLFCFVFSVFHGFNPFDVKVADQWGIIVLQSSIQIFFNTFKLRVLVANVGAGFDFILLIALQWNKSMKTLFSSIHRVPCGINVHLLEFQ